MKKFLENSFIIVIPFLLIIILFFTVYLEKIVIFLGDYSHFIESISLGMFSSLLVAYFFHFIVAKKLSNSIIEQVAEKTSKTAIDYATNEIYLNSKKVLPIKTYPKSEKPIEDFKNDFSLSLKKSNIYFFKGGVGMYTAYRLNRLQDYLGFSEKEIGMIILHPQSTEQLEAKVNFKYKDSIHPISKKDINKLLTKSQRKIFQVLTALFDIRKKLTVSLCFHSGDVIFREEILDDSIYISYYLGGDFPGTYKYLSDSYIYQAYNHNFRLSFNAFKDGIKFDKNLTDDEFSKLLQKLGFTEDIEVLRREYNEIFHKFDENNPFIKDKIF